MALNIKNRKVEELAAEVAHLTNENKTEAILNALLERRDRLRIGGARPNSRKARLDAFLRERLWPRIPKKELGRRLSKKRVERILGFGPEGV